MSAANTIALTRRPSPRLGACELTHLARTPIDVDVAMQQHAAYERVLADLGCTVLHLPDLPAQPDGVFVEDTAVVLDEVAVITRPGAASRRPERASVAYALASYRPLVALTDPATLDGGDVLRLGARLFVGASARTNAAGMEQLADVVRPYGYTVVPVAVHGCLHLKSAVTQVGPNRVLLNPDWVDPTVFADYDPIYIHPDEPFAANAVWVQNAVIFPEAFPQTRQRLAAEGFTVRTVPASELAKAEGGVSCCCLLVDGLQ